MFRNFATGLYKKCKTGKEEKLVSVQVNQLCVKNMSLIGRRLLKSCEDGTEIAIKISIRPLEIRINFEGGKEK